ncbi:glutaredoxin-like protein NrdH [Vreelandella jeotgali]|uniref:glutaredoxin-like protein NrdH n=1 Tax=Vreelandella jeotgali TaxID=553386 RepID=UPI00037B6D2A|nr:glutaredoxin-like protein NrdH [Halomonas jeotgali]
MAITVYSAASCVQCKATYRELEKQGLSYTVINLDETPEARDDLVQLGHRQLPVVTAGEVHWSGFRPDRIRELTAATA